MKNDFYIGDRVRVDRRALGIAKHQGITDKTTMQVIGVLFDRIMVKVRGRELFFWPDQLVLARSVFAPPRKRTKKTKKTKQKKAKQKKKTP